MKWDIRMPHTQKNTTRLMMRMMGISLVLAFAGFPISHPDTISAWTDFRFAEFCKDSSSYDEFFTILKEDLEGNRPINLSDIDHRRVILDYAQLRNAWVKSGNLSNFRMAVVITKALCQLLGAEALEVFEGKRAASGLKGPELLDDVCLTRDEVFTPLNGHFKKAMGSYQPLRELKDLNRLSIRDTAWTSYVEQFDLEYRRWGAIEFLSSPGEDPILVQLSCFRDHLRDFRPAEIVQRCAAIVDYHNKLTLIYSVLDSLGDGAIDRGIVKVFSKKKAELRIEYLFSSTSIPDHQATQAFSFLNFLAKGIVGWRCPRLIDASCD